MSNSHNTYPPNVGIVALEIYFPSRYVDQIELEKFDGSSAGKYTIGLGQSKMGFCDDREDINSLCLTVVNNLMERNKICYKNIGRLEVGTETIIDKSKSVKSVLMQLFEESGNTDVEGIDTTNACYGGTAALFNAFNWIESSAWDGRLALVVCADIAVYASGNARPTGGAGAVAMLVGPNAALVYERGLRSSHMQHAYDFYKPNLMSEYPVVDGKLSVECYLSSLDRCYQLFKSKVKSKDKYDFSLDSAEAFLFHSPYCKLVQKSLARLLLNDFQVDQNSVNNYPELEKFRSLKLNETYFDRDVETAVLKASEPIFLSKTKPYLLIANQVGNMYTPSLYGGLASYISRTKLEDIANKRIVLFSYGSGLASSMFSLCGVDGSQAVLQRLHENLSNLSVRLNSRTSIEPNIFEQTMKLREDTHHLAPYSPKGNVDELFEGTWYLENIDDKHRRTYKRMSKHLPNGSS